jgi:hypothetical protein
LAESKSFSKRNRPRIGFIAVLIPFLGFYIKPFTQLC